MSNEQHTPTPWIICNSTDIFTELGQTNRDGIEANNNDGWQIADCSVGKTSVGGELIELSFKEAQANARRIVAAVNATAGITTETLEEMPRMWVENRAELDIEFSRRMYAEIDRLKQENSELLLMVDTSVSAGKLAEEALELIRLKQQNAELAKTVDWYGKLLCRRDEQITELVEVLKETDDYLSENQLNYVGHKSILHSKMIAAIAKHVPTDAAAAESSKKDIETLMEKGLQYLMKESSNPPFFDPHGLEPKGVVRVVLPHLEEEVTGLTPEEFRQRYQAQLAKAFTAQDIEILMTELDYIQQIGVMGNQIRAFVNASQSAMRLLSQNPDDAVAQSCVTELAKAINNVTIYGTGPVIQERPRPEEPDMYQSRQELDDQEIADASGL